MNQMIFIIFTAEGLTQATDDILHEKAGLWMNPELRAESDLSAFERAGIEIETLPHSVDVSNEKAVLAALAHVEALYPKSEILVEYL